MGEVERTYQVLHQAELASEEMKYDWEWYARSLNTVARLWVTVGKRGQALQTLGRVVRVAEEHLSGMDCSRVLINAAESLQDLGEREQVRQVLSQAISRAGSIVNRGRRAWALSEVALALIEAGEVEQAQQILNQAVPLAEGDDRAMSHVSLGLAQIGDVDRALTLASSAGNMDEASTGLRGVVQALLGQGNLNRALLVANSMIDDFFGQKAQALCNVAQYFIKVGDIEQARQVLAEALIVTEDIEVEDWRPYALSAVAQELVAVLRPGDTEFIPLIKKAFSRARSRGRREVLLHIEAFAEILGKLGVIEAVWVHIQEVEALWKR
jgi:tetratricopeptide (TPR) repeat protein